MQGQEQSDATRRHEVDDAREEANQEQHHNVGEETITRASGGETNIQPSSGKTMRKRNRLQENNKELKQSSEGELRNQAAAQTKQASRK